MDDKDSVLYTVTLFQRVVDDFKEAARDMRFMVKDFTYDEEAKKKQDEKMTDLKGDMRKKFNMLVKWCSTMFSEAFIAWTHLKVQLCSSLESMGSLRACHALTRFPIRVFGDAGELFATARRLGQPASMCVFCQRPSPITRVYARPITDRTRMLQLFAV